MKNSIRFRFNPLVWVLLIITLLFSLSGVGVNVYNLIVLSPFHSALPYVALLVLCLLLALLVVSVMLLSYYKVKGQTLVLRFGPIKSVYNLEKALNLTRFKSENLLILFFNDQTFTRIVVSEKKFSQVEDLIKKAVPSILINENDR